MSSDPVNWNAGDFHRWERPAGKPCPHCECCSAALCARAIEKDSACHWEGAGSDFDLSVCPCWRQGSSARATTESPTGDQTDA